MAAPDLRGFIQIGFDILNTTIDGVTKKILAQIGNAHKNTKDADQVEWWQHVGLASRPPKPEAGRRAAQAVVIRCGDHDIIIASQDMRGLDLYGALDYGETCLYASGETGTGQARILLKKDGSINLFTKEDNDTAGTGMGIFIAADGAISLVSHTGAGVLLTADGSLKAFTENGAFQIGTDGAVKLSSKVKVSVSAPAIVLGGAATTGVVTMTEMTTLIAAIAAGLTAVGVGAAAHGPAGATAFSSAAAAVTAALATKRVSAD